MNYNEETYRCVQLDTGIHYPLPAQFISVNSCDTSYWSDRRQVLDRSFVDAMLDVAWPGCHVLTVQGANWKDSWQYRGRAVVLPLYEGHARLAVRVSFPHKDKGEWELLDHLAFKWTPHYKPPRILRHRDTQEMWALDGNDIVIGKRDLGMVRKPFDVYLAITYDKDVPDNHEDYLLWRNTVMTRQRGRL